MPLGPSFPELQCTQASKRGGLWAGNIPLWEYFGRLQRSQQTNRERIWNPEVRVHGLIATVWAPYDFWTDGKFSHCGVDLFDLIKTAEGWKISGGAFTMESTCEPSLLGPLKR